MMNHFAILAVFIAVIFRRVLGIVALLILLLMVKGLVFDMGMGADLPLLFGLDWGLAIETSILLMALSVRDHVVAVVTVVKSWLLQRQVIHRFLRRFARRAPRSRPGSSLLPPPPDDEPAAWILAAA
jgi:Ni/Fe-hydrogenase subunit HybB-like protein